MAAARAVLAATAWNALINEVTSRDRRSDQSNQGMGVARHRTVSKPLQVAVSLTNAFGLRAFDFAATLGAGKMKHDVIPYEHRLNCRRRKGCLRGEADIRETGRNKPKRSGCEERSTEAGTWCAIERLIYGILNFCQDFKISIAHLIQAKKFPNPLYLLTLLGRTPSTINARQLVPTLRIETQGNVSRNWAHANTFSKLADLLQYPNFT